ncbi:MAG: Hpt domain-containing protein, partial [Planctomycetales bacterium]|nr:Hpt domain-containing protein [Planctomycetales bacterium]
MVLNDPEIIQEFLTESTEHLADIEQQLLEIEAGGEHVNVDLVNTVFRGVHSIKGAAGFMGFESVQGLAHSLESVLNLMREEALIPTSEIMDVLLGAADLLRQLFDDIENSNAVDVSEFVKPLDAIVAKAMAISDPDAAPQPEGPNASVDAGGVTTTAEPDAVPDADE